VEPVVTHRTDWLPTIPDTRQWKITKTHSGAHQYGRGWTALYDYMRGAYLAGECFKVSLRPSADVPVGLADVKFHEKTPECNPGADG